MNLEIKAKGYSLDKILSNWKKEGTIDQKKVILDRIPNICIDCNSESIEYWDETDEEIIFQCQSCKKFYPILFDPDKLKIYLFFS